MGIITWCMFAILLLYVVLGACIYHKIFDGAYCNVFNSIMRELFFVALFAVILIGLTLFFWKIAVVLIIIAAICAVMKVKSSIHQVIIAIAAVIICILICVCGSNLQEDDSDDDDASIVTPYEEYECEAEAE